MITGFENYTPKLNHFEHKVADFICDYLQGKRNNTPITKDNPINSNSLIQVINERFELKVSFAPQRVRACMNHIRGSQKLFVSATGKGYFWVRPTDVKEMNRAIQSLDERIAGINYANDGLKALREAAIRENLIARGRLF